MPDLVERYDWYDLPTPNYVDPPTRGWPPFFIVLYLIAAIFVGLRLYSRVVLSKSAGLDDVLIIPAILLGLGETVCMYRAVAYDGWDRHIWDIRPGRGKPAGLMAWLIELFFLLGTGCTKISILLVYRRIAAGSITKTFIRLTWVGIVFMIVYMLTFFIELVTVCHPLSAYWFRWDSEWLETHTYSCHSQNLALVSHSALSIVTDLYVAIIPMILVRNLKMNKNQRRGLMCIFGLGLFVAGAGAARLYFLNMTSKASYTDATWQGFAMFSCFHVESQVAIICASAPALNVLFRRLYSGPILKVYNNSVPRSKRPTVPTYPSFVRPSVGRTISTFSQTITSTLRTIGSRSTQEQDRPVLSPRHEYHAWITGTGSEKNYDEEKIDGNNTERDISDETTLEGSHTVPGSSSSSRSFSASDVLTHQETTLDRTETE